MNLNKNISSYIFTFFWWIENWWKSSCCSEHFPAFFSKPVSCPQPTSCSLLLGNTCIALKASYIKHRVKLCAWRTLCMCLCIHIWAAQQGTAWVHWFYTFPPEKSELQKQTPSPRDKIWICHCPWRTENPKINDQITLIRICRCLICNRYSIDRLLHFTRPFQIAKWEGTEDW